ncbi:WVD2-like protein 4 [Tanacetum coccineum]
MLADYHNPTLNFLSGVDHLNVIRLIGYSVSPNEKIIIYEYMSNNSLASFLLDDNKRKHIDWSRRVEILKGIADGLSYLHNDEAINLIHRDIKAANILLDDRMVAKIADFGMAKNEVDFDGQEVEKDVDYSKEIESDGQHVKKDVKDKIEIARAALIQQEIALITKEIELGLWSWDDLNSEGDAAEGVLGVGGDGSNSLKTVDRISKSNEVGSDNVVCGFKDVKSLSSKRISVCNIVSDNDDMVADGNNSKVGKVCVADCMVSDPKKSIESIESATKGKYAKSKNVIVGPIAGKAIADCHKVVFDILADGKSDDVESCDVKKGKTLLAKWRRVYNVVSDDDDDTVADDKKVYVADHVVNDKKKSIKRATKGKAGCDKVFSNVVDDADNYIKPVDSIVKGDKIESGDVSCDAKKSKSLSSKGRRVFKVVSGDADLIADDNKVIKPDDGISKFENVLVGNECKSSSTELKSVDVVYKCDKEYEDVPKKRTPSSRQRKIVNRFGCKVCGFEYLEKGLEYDNEPTFEEIQKTMLGVGYRKGNGPNQPLESTLLKTGFSPTWRLLMAYISNSLGGNIGSKDQLNYMHQLIAHRLINGVKLDYGGIIFNDLAAKLTNSVCHTSPTYLRFISLILEKALGDSYVLSDEIGLKIPIMGNSIFNLDPSLLEVPISSHMVRVCQSEPDSAVVSEDVAGILLSDNVSDGSPSIDTNLNEIVQKVKTKSINSLLDPKFKESTGVYEYKVVSNCLNEEVVADTAVVIDYDSVHSYIYFLGRGCWRHSSWHRKEVVVGDTAVPTGSGENLKDGCTVNSNEVPNYHNNGGDQSLKDGCHVNSNEVCNYHNDGGSFHEVQTESNLFDIMVSKQVSPAQSFEKLIYEGDDTMNVDCDDECENQGNNAFVEDVDRSSLNQSVLTVFIDNIRLLSNQVTALVNEQANLKDMVNKLVTSPVPSTKALVAEVVKCVNASFSSLTVEIKNGIASGQKEIKDKVNVSKKYLSSKSSTYDITKEVISAIELELKNIKDHITKIETPSFPSKESLIAEFVKCIKTTNSSVSKDVTHLISKQKELSDEVQQLRDSSLSKTSTEDISKAVFALIKPELKTFILSITDLFSKIKVNIHRHVQLSPEFASIPAKIQELCSTMNDIVNFKVNISNLANKAQENVSTFKEFCDYFSNFQNSVNVFENLVEESIPTKKEREEDQQLLDVILLDQGIIKGKISKIAECMLLLVKWAKNICVDDSASIAKTIVAYEEASLKQAEFDKYFTELTINPESNVIPASTIQEPTSSVLSEDVCHERPQTETSSHVVVAEIHTTYAQKERKQHIVAESSNKNDEICDNITANPTSFDKSLSHKPDDIFRYEAGGVEHVMTSEEIAKQKEDEEIIKSKNEENKASYAEVLRVIEEEARSLQIQKKMKTNNCKSSSKIKSYFMIDSEHSTVTYTSVSFPVEDDSDIGSPGVDGPPIMPEDPYAYIMAAYEVPPSPDYIPGPEMKRVKSEDKIKEKKGDIVFLHLFGTLM